MGAKRMSLNIPQSTRNAVLTERLMNSLGTKSNEKSNKAKGFMVMMMEDALEDSESHQLSRRQSQ